MGINDLIQYLGRAYSLDRSTAVQAIIAVAGVVISVSASLAALISAWSTAKSVKEMKSARLQQARPDIYPLSNVRFECRWIKRDNNYHFFQDSKKLKSVGPSLKNVGFGSAISAEFYLDQQPYRSMKTMDVANLVRVFRASNLQVLKANNGIEVRDPFDVKKLIKRLIYNPVSSRNIINYVGVSDEVTAGMNPLFMDSFVSSAISHFDSEDGFSSIWVMNVKYCSIAGEIFKKKYILSISSGDFAFVLDHPVGQRDGVVNWSEMHFNITFSMHEISGRKTIFKKIFEVASIKLQPFRSKISKRIWNFNDYLCNKLLEKSDLLPRFDIGDRVVFKDFESWSVENVEEFEEIPVTEIDDNLYKKSEER